jgi:two-component system chemotaxis response regulator CheY
MSQVLSVIDKKVLIAEDSPSMRAELVGILKKLNFFEIFEAPNGVEAREELLKQAKWGKPYDLIFLDINMPKMNGIQLLKEIRALATYKTTTILIVSAINEKETIIKAIVAGATDYMIKPYDASYIREKLIKHLK